MEESISVYESLRENILHEEDRISNETIYMYVTYFALLTVSSLWNSWLSMVSYIVLIVFQSMINSSIWSIKKSSIYIKIFFETKNNNIHWESLHTDPDYVSVYKSINRNVGWYVCKYGSSFLALISFSAILIPILSASSWKLCLVSTIDTVKIFLSAVLCGLVIHVNKIYFRLREGNLDTDQRLYDIVEQFYYKTTKHDIPTNCPIPYKITRMR